MIELLYGLGLVGAIVLGYVAWKKHWKIADIFQAKKTFVFDIVFSRSRDGAVECISEYRQQFQEKLRLIFDICFSTRNVSSFTTLWSPSSRSKSDSLAASQ